MSVLADRIRRAQRLTILTGAGVSAASGVPTFRGTEGLWKQFRPEDLATPDAFRRNPGLVWEWYDWRRGRIAACRPNAAHEVLAQWSQGRLATDGAAHDRPTPVSVTVVTQNVDDLHVRAGTENLVRIHGSIWELSCWGRCAAGSTPWRDERTSLGDLPARCPHCGDLARPAVVWFGEALSDVTLRAALQATACDVFLTIGTSSVVFPAASLVHEAAALGAFTAEINLEETPASSVTDVSLRGPVEVILPQLAALVSRG